MQLVTMHRMAEWLLSKIVFVCDYFDDMHCNDSWTLHANQRCLVYRSNIHVFQENNYATHKSNILRTWGIVTINGTLPGLPQIIL